MRRTRMKAPDRKVEWTQLLNPKRLGCEDHVDWTDEEARNEYQRDFDRIAFSHAFRRLQGKTQVFPLPDNDLVHNRLTHSLESASVGKYLGGLVARKIDQPIDVLASIVSAACLAHDIGNPPFGHSGEAAISDYFQSGDGAAYMKQLKEEERYDFVNFEGNAMALRMLCHRKPAATQVMGGERLTYSTLAALAKYPRASKLSNLNSTRASQKKFGVFRSELRSFKMVADELGLSHASRDSRDASWFRHPLAFLVEAADDICYKVGDAEDGLKLGYISPNELTPILQRIAEVHFAASEIERSLMRINDQREKIGYLRAKAMNSLIYQTADSFCEHEAEIRSAEFDLPLLEEIPSYDDLMELSSFTERRIYSAAVVVKIEAAGFEVLPGLLNTLLPAVLTQSGTTRGAKISQLIPSQYHNTSSHSELGVSDDYEKIMSIVEFVSGMTDRYATNLFRTFRGISLPGY